MMSNSVMFKILSLLLFAISYLFLFTSPAAKIIGWALWVSLLVIYVLDEKQKARRGGTTTP